MPPGRSGAAGRACRASPIGGRSPNDGYGIGIGPCDRGQNTGDVGRSAGVCSHRIPTTLRSFADLDQDGGVDAADLTILLSDWGG
jgi:hypothetical protein